MKKSGKITAILGIFLLGAAIVFPILIFIPTGRSTSVGIIGGADGPTAVFIAAQLKYPILLEIFLLLAAVGCFVISFIIRKKFGK